MRGPLPHIANLKTYEPGRPIEEVAREVGMGLVDGIHKLASNENLLGPSPKAMEAMQAAVSDMHFYPDGGTFYLRQRLADYLKVDSSQILPGNGSNELIELLGRVYLGPGRNLVMANQAFVVYRLIAAACEADVHSVPMQAFTHDLPAMAATVDDATQMIFVANPNNPTGTMVDEAALDALVESVPESVLIIIDEAYIELLNESDQPNTLKWIRNGHRNVVVLRTFSKTYGLAGLRLGYAVAHEEVIQLLNKVRQPFNANAMAQRAAMAALEDRAHVERTRQLVADESAYLTRELELLGLSVVPSQANFLLVRVGPGRQVFEALQSKAVIVRPMDGYAYPSTFASPMGHEPRTKRRFRH